jgi:hypothetical protein
LDHHRTPDGGSRLTYRDFSTRRSWVCGTAPADVPSKAMLEWVIDRCRYFDVINDRGDVFVVGQPVIDPCMM